MAPLPAGQQTAATCAEWVTWGSQSSQQGMSHLGLFMERSSCNRHISEARILTRHPPEAHPAWLLCFMPHFPRKDQNIVAWHLAVLHPSDSPAVTYPLCELIFTPVKFTFQDCWAG